VSVVVDASLVIKWLTDETDSQAADDLFARWRLTGFQPVAPIVALPEITNVLLKHVADGVTTLEDAVERIPSLPRYVEFVDLTLVHAQRALTIANAVGSRAVYDFYYVALAEELGCEFWTADALLWRSIRGSFPNVRLLAVDSV